MDCPTGPHPLVQDEKDRISSEYVTFALNAERVKRESPKTLSQTEIWYILLTEEKFYSQCKKFNQFALKIINRSANEGIVEVEVKSIKNISTSARALKMSQLKGSISSLQTAHILLLQQS